MWKYTVQVNGMMCGMCESHVNDAVRKAFPVKKVSSSRSKKETTVIAETELDEDALRAAEQNWDAAAPEDAAARAGELLFAAVNAIRLAGVDAEEALTFASKRFRDELLAPQAGANGYQAETPAPIDRK